VKDLVAEHDLWHSRRIAAPDVYQKPTDVERQAKPPAYHKLVQRAPDDEGDTLYVAAHASKIVGYSDTEGQRLIDELLAHCTQPKYVYSLQWKNAGDLVIWDNRQVMHRGTDFDDALEVRDMRRTTVFDDGPGRVGINPDMASAQTRV